MPTPLSSRPTWLRFRLFLRLTFSRDDATTVLLGVGRNRSVVESKLAVAGSEILRSSSQAEPKLRDATLCRAGPQLQHHIPTIYPTHPRCDRASLGDAIKDIQLAPDHEALIRERNGVYQNRAPGRRVSEPWFVMMSKNDLLTSYQSLEVSIA